MKHISYNYFRPFFYFNRLFAFFIIISLSLTFMLMSLEEFSIEMFFLKFFIVFFMIMAIGVLVEFSSKGEYINPLDCYSVQGFVKSFLEVCELEGVNKAKNYLLKYDNKSKKFIQKNLHNRKYFISTIKKEKKTFIVTLIDEKKFFEYFFIKFFVRKAIIKLYIHKKGNSFEIIRCS